MNKRNFGRVIKRIQANLELWDQGNPPNFAVSEEHGLVHDCKTPYCFLGHAEFLRTGKKYITPPDTVVECSHELAAWLGVDHKDLGTLFNSNNGLNDFKRWHKAGKVS